MFLYSLHHLLPCLTPAAVFVLTAASLPPAPPLQLAANCPSPPFPSLRSSFLLLLLDIYLPAIGQSPSDLMRTQRWQTTGKNCFITGTLEQSVGFYFETFVTIVLVNSPPARPFIFPPHSMCVFFLTQSVSHFFPFPPDCWLLHRHRAAVPVNMIYHDRRH